MSSTLLDKPPETPQRARRWWVLSATFAAVIVLTAAVTFLLARSGNDHSAAPPAPAPSASQSTVAQVPAPTTKPTTGTASPSPTVPAFRYLPLWPFDSVADAIAWQKDALLGGHQPWRLSPDLTALAFTTGYLQFTTVDRSLGTTVDGDEAWVQVGRRTENGADHTAAVIHLAPIGSGANRPWEVVGTRDETLSLTTPAYGASIASPVTVGVGSRASTRACASRFAAPARPGYWARPPGYRPAVRTSRGRLRCHSGRPRARSARTSSRPAGMPDRGWSASRSPVSG